MHSRSENRVAVALAAAVTIMLAMLAVGAALGVVVVNFAPSQTTRDVPANQESVLRTTDEVSLFVQKSSELFRPVATVGIEGQREGGLEPVIVGEGSGFLFNESTFVTAAHVARDAMKESLNGRIVAEFAFVNGIPYFELSNPIFSPDGMFAFYRLSSSDVSSLKKYKMSFFPIGDVQNIPLGKHAFMLTGNRNRFSQYGIFWQSSLVTFVDWRDSLYAPMFSMGDSGQQDEFSHEIGVPLGIHGDSGSPVVVFNEQTGQFVLVGVVETPATARRADLLVEFLAQEGKTPSKN